MKLIRNIYSYILLTAIALVSLTSCGMMTEDEPDCNPYYKVRFRFDMNMLYADAFSTQVKEVDLYVYDTDGKLVWQGHEDGAVLAEEGYLMDLPVAPGTYDLVAWCRNRHENAADFRMDDHPSPGQKEGLRVTMDREYDGETAHSTTDLHALFHGKIDNVELPDKWGTHIVTVPLIKDTNSIRIMLVHLSGSEIKASDFDFKITDSNGRLDHDNTIMEDEIIEYRTWAKGEGLAQTNLPIVGGSVSNLPSLSSPFITSLTRAPQTKVHSVIAELTTSRLQTCQNPILTVTRTSDGEKVIQIPIIDYFLMVKGEYRRDMTDDEFLDRQDDYHLTFFMHEDGSWFKSIFDVLQWRVVNQETEL
ncbi:MAG: FimB/Mfa2 family fimbrial subunit [Bacteroidales bacterium]|nr:FimB/Mfa2 family fimbrial subunit [Bacteroidales bacterium]